MAGLNPKAIREALASSLDAALTRAVAVYAYAPNVDPDEVPDYPAILIGHAPGTDFAITFGDQGIAELHLEIEIRTESADPPSAEIALDDLIRAGTGATSSVYDALMANPTISGNATGLRVVDFAPPRPLGRATGRWSASFIIAVYQSRS